MWVVISGLSGAIITGLVAIILDRRSKSGRIETTEAKDLWDTLRGELSRLQNETTSLRAEITVARQEIAALREDATIVGNKAAETSATLRICTAELKRLREYVITLGGDPGTIPEIPGM